MGKDEYGRSVGCRSLGVCKTLVSVGCRSLGVCKTLVSVGCSSLGVCKTLVSVGCSSLVVSAVDDMLRLRTVLESAGEHIHSSAQLFKLAQDAFKTATAPELPRHYALLNASLELGLQVT